MAKQHNDEDQVRQFMTALEHPMKAEIETLRDIIKGAAERISERIKWNAPSYYYREDLVTFGPFGRKADEILLVFHHPAIVQISSPILTGDYTNRRLATFHNMEEIDAGRDELRRILSFLTQHVDTIFSTSP